MVKVTFNKHTRRICNRKISITQRELFFLILIVIVFNIFDYRPGIITNLSLEPTSPVSPSPLSPLPYQYPTNVLSLEKLAKCTREQMSVIEKQLRFDVCNTTNPQHVPPVTIPCGYGIYYETHCTDNTWLRDYFQNDFQSTRTLLDHENDDENDNHKFIGVNIGCNKGFDAIDLARMGMNDPDFDKFQWRKALGKKQLHSNGSCRQGKFTSQYPILNNHTNLIRRSGEIHCVEPIPSTTQILESATKTLGLDTKKEQRFVLSKAAISSSDGVAKFPNPEHAKFGRENLGIDACMQNENKMDNKAQCVDVPRYSLQTYVQKFVNSTGPINVLMIDVEGHDFDVLLGAGNVLERTEYLEFEYHKAGNWINYHLMDAIHLLDNKGFTCYWAGKGKLWRLSGCDHSIYNTYHTWSNVACVHRSQQVLATKMEQLFLETLQLPFELIKYHRKVTQLINETKIQTRIMT